MRYGYVPFYALPVTLLGLLSVGMHLVMYMSGWRLVLGEDGMCGGGFGEGEPGRERGKGRDETR